MHLPPVPNDPDKASTTPTKDPALMSTVWIEPRVNAWMSTDRHYLVPLLEEAAMMFAPTKHILTSTRSNVARYLQWIGESEAELKKAALIDELHELLRKDVPPHLRYDGVYVEPTTASVELAERLIHNLPENVELPDVCVPDDGEITFSWESEDDQGVRWNAGLMISPECEVSGHVVSHPRSDPLFFEFDGSVSVDGAEELSAFMQAVTTHWRTP